MGCFLACFGYSQKQKRLKPSNKVPSGDQLQRHGSYQPLDSDVTVNFDIKENPQVSDSKFSKKAKERSSLRPKKKVSFNLNVKTYEPIPKEETINYFSESEEEEKKCEENEEETTKEGVSLSLFKGDSLALGVESYPSNYRYQNCRDSYDEEDKIELEESDLDDDEYDEDEDEDDDDDDDDNGDGGKKREEEFPEQLNSLTVESGKWVTFPQLVSEKFNNHMPFSASLNQELNKLESNRNPRYRSEYVHSVLNPVENLTQWKAVKARSANTLKQQRKENIKLEQEQLMPLNLNPTVNLSSPFNCKTNFSQSKPLMQDIAVDASLSNWLVSSEKRTITKSSNVTIISMSSNKNIVDRSKFMHQRR